MAQLGIKPFKYFQPSKLKELMRLLARFGDKGKIIAGGTDLVLQLKSREIPSPQYIFDIENIDELNYIKDEREVIRIGAILKHYKLQSSSVIDEKLPLLKEAIDQLGTPQIRNVGTIGGNLCNASPAADASLPLMVLGAQLKIVSTGGERKIPIEKFFKSVKKTTLKNSELLTEILIPRQTNEYGGAFMKIGRRNGHDISLVNGAVMLKLSNGRIEDLCIALGSVGPTPMRALKTETFLKGKEYSEENVRKASAISSSEIRPISDVRASAEYRRQVVESLVEIAIQRAGAKFKR
jgi:CO/xanthine dehydrogenase FAD-binding subunit